MSWIQNEKTAKRVIWGAAIAVPVVVAVLFMLPPAESLSEETRKALYVLPTLNAFFNGTAFLCLTVAFIAIRKKNITVHRAATTTALGLSVLFLLSYVAFHLTTESTKFGGEGAIRTVYFIVLLSHILLSAVIIPLVLFTWLRGFTMQVEMVMI